MGTVYAQADFKIEGEGQEFTVHAMLEKSGAFDYGNGTCMCFVWGDGNVEGFDTRYDPVNADNFAEFALECLRKRCRKTFTVSLV